MKDGHCSLARSRAANYFELPGFSDLACFVGFGVLGSWCLFELMLLHLLKMMLRRPSSHNMTCLLLPHAGLPYVDAVEERFGGLSKFRGTIGLIVFGGLS